MKSRKSGEKGLEGHVRRLQPLFQGSHVTRSQSECGCRSAPGAKPVISVEQWPRFNSPPLVVELVHLHVRIIDHLLWLDLSRCFVPAAESISSCFQCLFLLRTDILAALYHTNSTAKCLLPESLWLVVVVCAALSTWPCREQR